MVGDARAKGRLSPNRLELEVTESICLTDGDGALKILKQLQMQGIRIALDDFGTGYSSLGYLNKAIFNKLKIDRSFVREAGIKKEAVLLVQARSEEHTSELQSLMRISYAVFCLQKNTQHTHSIICTLHPHNNT